MSINSLACVQSFINKTKAGGLPAIIATITNTAAPAPFQPGFY